MSLQNSGLIFADNPNVSQIFWRIIFIKQQQTESSCSRWMNCVSNTLTRNPRCPCLDNILCNVYEDIYTERQPGGWNIVPLLTAKVPLIIYAFKNSLPWSIKTQPTSNLSVERRVMPRLDELPNLSLTGLSWEVVRFVSFRLEWFLSWLKSQIFDSLSTSYKH